MSLGSPGFILNFINLEHNFSGWKGQMSHCAHIFSFTVSSACWRLWQPRTLSFYILVFLVVGSINFPKTVAMSFGYVAYIMISPNASVPFQTITNFSISNSRQDTNTTEKRWPVKASLYSISHSNRNPHSPPIRQFILAKLEVGYN